ncbi:MAG: glycerol kinase GlpK [Chloroflexi bacterium]|nr:glycerol kinase GlpK [Chloroflexota bacterium]
MTRVVVAIDQGTTSSRAIAFDRAGTVVAAAQREFEQHYPSPGHVTHDPEAIWDTQLTVAREVVAAVGGPSAVVAIGIANQRETTLVWDRATGLPVADAIVWQSRITVPFCAALRAAGHGPLVRSRTGLPIDAYFSGPKIRHILDSAPGLRTRAEAGELAFGTVDTFLLWRLTGGAVHATDVSNASRTLLYDIHRLAWDPELLSLVDVPAAVLPAVRSSSEVYGETEPALFGAPIPIAGVAGDQQAATFGQACFRPGQAKNTYGTGAFLLLNTGDRIVSSANGLLSTVGWQLGPNGPVTYALEGSVFVAGAAVQWIRDELRAIGSSAEIEALAAGAKDTGGVYFVPAFVGLGAPYWDPTARGALLGLTRGTGLAEIARATIESIAYQVRDVLDAMNADTGSPLASLRVDGGAAVNDTLLQFQADLLDVPVERPMIAETTALGAAYLAGLAVGYWRDLADLEANWRLDRRFEPSMDPARRDRLCAGWRRAVERARGWVEADAETSP